ncbi:putative transcription factor bHLH041 [Lotus japonicus]|uniref:putative transcription factor bHLH041 n=1 Tax=Lotus japonicus TaxID=34305 RepID=UPI002583259F|nr:putative transcription factor bHLH041 [Lotus japonicus]
MDGVFSLPEPARIDFLRSLVRSFHCTYICLWRYQHSNLSNRLFFLDGFYNVTSDQPSSSLGSCSVAERGFNQYQRLTFDVNNDCVPGLAFKYRLPYLELQQLDLLRLTSTDMQTQFYQKKKMCGCCYHLQTTIFMGCNKGEIELGFSSTCQADIRTALGNLFPEVLCLQSQSIDQNPLSSSSSSLIPLSTSGSHEYPSMLFRNETLSMVSKVPLTQTSPYQQTIQASTQTVPSQTISTPEGEHDAIVRAFLHVMSPPSSSSTSHNQQNSPCTSLVHPEATAAFKRYNRPDTIVPNRTSQTGSNFRGQSLLNRSFAFCRSLNLMRMRERVQAARSTRTHLDHVISERRRRENLNKNFQALRALLPPGTKRDKASIITAAKETMRALLADIVKLNLRNQKLMKLLSAKERLHVQVSDVTEASSSQEGRMIDLQVTLRGDSSQVDLLIRLLEFLKLVQNVTLISMDTNTYIIQGTTINRLTFRLRSIQGSEWDESAFMDAVRRVVADFIAMV